MADCVCDWKSKGEPWSELCPRFRAECDRIAAIPENMLRGEPWDWRTAVVDPFKALAR